MWLYFPPDCALSEEEYHGLIEGLKEEFEGRGMRTSISAWFITEIVEGVSYSETTRTGRKNRRRLALRSTRRTNGTFMIARSRKGVIAMALTDDELALLSTLAYLEKSDVLDNGLIDNFWNGAYENQDVTLGDVLDKVADDSVIADLRSEGKRDQKDSLRITGAEWADALRRRAGTRASAASPTWTWTPSPRTARGRSASPRATRPTCVPGDRQRPHLRRQRVGGQLRRAVAVGHARPARGAQLRGVRPRAHRPRRHGDRALQGRQQGHVRGCALPARRALRVLRRQGFGTAFLARHGALVAKRAGVIGAYNLDGDFVSPLLRPIAGKMVWLNGSRANGDLLKNHSPIALFGESAALASGADRGALSVQVGRFSDFLLHAVPEGQLRPLADLLGDAASIALGGVEGDLLSVVAGNPEGWGPWWRC